MTGTTSAPAPAPEPRPLTPRPDPTPELPRLRRRLADRLELRDALLAAIAERRPPSAGSGTSTSGSGTSTSDLGPTLGSRLDVAGDPTILTIAELWSRVADSVAAYTELTAGERYIGTAQDWTDLRRTIDLLGHRPTQRSAARGWVRFITDSHTDPLVPAGTRVQAAGTATEDPQTFETIADTQLRAEWADLTVTAVPQPTAPTGPNLRLLTDPGFAAGDQILLIAERLTAPDVMPVVWGSWLHRVIAFAGSAAASATVRGMVRITHRKEDLGACLLTTDRDLTPLLEPDPDVRHVAYRVRTILTLARRLSKLSYVNDKGVAKTASVSYGSEQAPVTASSLLVTEAGAVTPGIGIVVWGSSGAHVTTVSSVSSLNWSVAPGSTTQVGKIGLTEALPLVLRNQNVQVALIENRTVAQHYELPPLAPGNLRVRIHPRPTAVPERLTVHTSSGWELAQATLDPEDVAIDTGGMLLTLSTPFTGTAEAAEASANLAEVRHGTSTSAALTLTGGSTVVPGPVAGDVTPDGAVTNSLEVRVGGVAFEEAGSLYGRSASDRVFTTRLAADGRLVLQFGDGVAGALPRGEVSARWRIGGGLAGELDATRIDTLLGSVRGVRKVAGIGRTTGAADQEGCHRMRQAAAARVRALDRAVSAADLVDLTMTVPGTSHAATWRGPGPAGCACGGMGLHLAVLRLTRSGVRPSAPAELTSLAGYLDARRDTTVPLCVAAGVASAVSLEVTVVVDSSHDPATVRAAIGAALRDPAGRLASQPRVMGVPLDASDVLAVIHEVPGVLGVTALTLGRGLQAPSPREFAIGRVPAARYEVLGAGAVKVRIA